MPLQLCVAVVTTAKEHIAIARLACIVYNGP